MKLPMEYVIENKGEVEIISDYFVCLICDWGQISKNIHANVVKWVVNEKLKTLDKMRKIFSLLNSVRVSRALPHSSHVPGYANKTKGTGRKGHKNKNKLKLNPRYILCFCALI